jgi:hypothetical protein
VESLVRFAMQTPMILQKINLANVFQDLQETVANLRV